MPDVYLVLHTEPFKPDEFPEATTLLRKLKQATSVEVTHTPPDPSQWTSNTVMMSMPMPLTPAGYQQLQMMVARRDFQSLIPNIKTVKDNATATPRPQIQPALHPTFPMRPDQERSSASTLPQQSTQAQTDRIATLYPTFATRPELEQAPGSSSLPASSPVIPVPVSSSSSTPVTVKPHGPGFNPNIKAATQASEGIFDRILRGFNRSIGSSSEARVDPKDAQGINFQTALVNLLQTSRSGREINAVAWDLVDHINNGESKYFQTDVGKLLTAIRSEFSQNNGALPPGNEGRFIQHLVATLTGKPVASDKVLDELDQYQDQVFGSATQYSPRPGM